MLKKAISGVLVSLRDSTYRSVRLASPLTAALLNGLFEHPETVLTSAPYANDLPVPLGHGNLLRSRRDPGSREIAQNLSARRPRDRRALEEEWRLFGTLRELLRAGVSQTEGQEKRTSTPRSWQSMVPGTFFSLDGIDD